MKPQVIVRGYRRHRVGSACVPGFLLFSIFCSLFSPVHASLFQDSVQRYEAGDYKAAMLGFMDVVLGEPENASARDYLRRTGAELLRKDENLARERGRKLLEEARLVKNRKDEFRKAAAKRLKTWRELHETAKSRASNPDTVREAVLAYENFLKNAPVYSDGYPEFQSALRELKERFHRTIKDKYPHLIGNRSALDERDLAAFFFVRESASEFSYRHAYSNQPQAILDKAAAIRRAEIETGKAYLNARKAQQAYSSGRYQEAVDLWGEVLAVDHANEEARMYLDFAGNHIGSADAAPPAAAPVPRPAVTPVPRPVADRRPVSASGKKTSPRKSIAVTAQVPRRGEKANSHKPIANRQEAIGKGSGTDNSEEAEKFYEKGVLEFSLGDMAAAAGHWEECLKLNPRHLKAKAGLERIGKSLQ